MDAGRMQSVRSARAQPLKAPPGLSWPASPRLPVGTLRMGHTALPTDRARPMVTQREMVAPTPKTASSCAPGWRGVPEARCPLCPFSIGRTPSVTPGSGLNVQPISFASPMTTRRPGSMHEPAPTGAGRRWPARGRPRACMAGTMDPCRPRAYEARRMSRSDARIKGYRRRAGAVALEDPATAVNGGPLTSRRVPSPPTGPLPCPRPAAPTPPLWQPLSPRPQGGACPAAPCVSRAAFGIAPAGLGPPIDHEKTADGAAVCC